MADVDEVWLLKNMSVACLTLPTILAPLDLFVIQDIRQLATFRFFNQGEADPTGSIGDILPFFVITDFITIFALHVRLEIDNRRRHESLEDSTYNVSVLRLLAILALFASIIALTQATSLTKVIDFTMAAKLSMTVAMSVCPILFVVSHAGMRNLVRTKIGNIKLVL